MDKIKVLYAEDDETLAFLTKDNLEQEGFRVTHCNNGLTCLSSFERDTFDVCVLDIMLPGMDGFELTEKMRRINPHVPILFLSSKTLKEDRIKGLKLGADDYLIKPFSIEELILRIGVFLRRTGRHATHNNGVSYVVGKYAFNPAEFELRDGEKVITLTQREAELLRYFLDNRDRVVKRKDVLKAIWGNDDYFLGRSLDVFVSRLRKLLAGENISIQNVHGVGFRFSQGDIP
jgi:DNA-binding response OmpR family regulator